MAMAKCHVMKPLTRGNDRYEHRMVKLHIICKLPVHIDLDITPDHRTPDPR